MKPKTTCLQKSCQIKNKTLLNVGSTFNRILITVSVIKEVTQVSYGITYQLEQRVDSKLNLIFKSSLTSNSNRQSYK